MSGSFREFDRDALGAQMHALMTELFPICRSITGDGFRQSLAIVGRHIPLALHEVPSGTAAFDWTVPREWNIRDAYIKNAQGQRVVDFRAHTLHVLNYSVPVHRTMSLAELRPHLYSIPEHPDWIPYRTSYYAERWGFCLSHRALEALPADFRMAVVLCDVEGLSYKEIADAMDCPVGTVMSRLFRGRRLLEAQLRSFAVAEGYVKDEAAPPATEVGEPIDLAAYRRKKS